MDEQQQLAVVDQPAQAPDKCLMESPNTIFHVGVSGGKDSAAVLLYMVHRSGIPLSKIVASFCDITNDHEWTIAHVQLLSEKVHPIETVYPDWGDLVTEREGERLTYFDLALHKHRFPGTKTRFCTEFLKIYATQRRIRQLRLMGKNVIAVSGVRADESDDRKNLPAWDFSGNLLCWQWRPLIAWTLKDVLDIHREHGIPLNPLYAIGAQRVGCWPCIMSRKAEIRTIALQFPERIDQIRKMEQEFVTRYGRYSSFFPTKTVPPRFRSIPYTCKDGRKEMVCSIDDVVRWSMTGHRAKGHYTDHEEKEPISCSSGYCE